MSWIYENIIRELTQISFMEKENLLRILTAHIEGEVVHAQGQATVEEDEEEDEDEPEEESWDSTDEYQSALREFRQLNEEYTKLIAPGTLSGSFHIDVEVSIGLTPEWTSLMDLIDSGDPDSFLDGSNFGLDPYATVSSTNVPENIRNSIDVDSIAENIDVSQLKELFPEMSAKLESLQRRVDDFRNRYDDKIQDAFGDYYSFL